MNTFRYIGIYYPVIGCSATCFEGNKNRVAWSRKLGGYVGFWKWLPYIGIKCRVKDPKKPYKQYIIDKIENHSDMVIKKWYFDNEHKDQGFMWTVVTTKGEYVGNIENAYAIINLTALTRTGGPGSGIQIGYDKNKDIAYGWSHRARCGFKKGDKLFEENFGDDQTIYSQHGNKTIRSYADQMKAARNFAKYVS